MPRENWGANSKIKIYLLGAIASAKALISELKPRQNVILHLKITLKT